MHHVEQDANPAAPAQAAVKERLHPTEGAGDDRDPVTALQAQPGRVDRIAGAQTDGFHEPVWQDSRLGGPRCVTHFAGLREFRGSRLLAAR